jgi:hypothetical protein
MGIISKLFGFKKKEQSKDVNSVNKTLGDSISSTDFPKEALDISQLNYDSAADRAKYIKNSCEQILECTKQLEDLKTEYQAVTSYMTDIQKIDLIPKEEREQLNEAARKIITSTRERAKYQNKTIKISDSQFKNIAKYEDTMADELKKMKEYEIYQTTIKNDMQYLDGEKGSLNYQIEEIEDKHDYLNKMAITTSIFVILLFGIFIILGNLYEANMQIPFLMTIIMALFSAIYIFINAASNKKEMKLVERKLNRAIVILNKVKIKYINNTNALDYSYQKFMVNSYAELNYLWEQYLKAKEEEKSYRKNTELLEYNNRELITELKIYDIADPDIWIYQAAAILDDKEMVEVRHRLNVRRQKLRERIDYNNKLKDTSIEEIQKLLDQKPESRDEIASMLRELGINL